VALNHGFSCCIAVDLKHNAQYNNLESEREKEEKMRKRHQYTVIFLVRLVILLTAVNILPFPLFSFAQGSDTLWTRTFGGNMNDEASSVQQTSDGGYIITGYTESLGAGLYDIYLVKTDGYGEGLWAKTYGGPHYEYAYGVQQTSDGGYIIAGGIYSIDEDWGNAYLIKTDSIGDTLWTKTYGLAEKWANAFSVTLTSDHGYLLAGCQDRDVWWNQDFYVVKTDSMGDTLWTRTFESEPYHCDWATSALQTTNHGYIVAGITGLQGSPVWDIYVVRLDSLGNTLWEKTYGAGDIYVADFGFEIQGTTDGGYIIAGATDSTSNGSFDMCLVKIDARGGKLWTKIYGGEYDDFASSVKQTTDGGFIVAGHKNTASTPEDYCMCFLVKTDANGDTTWTRSYGSGTGYDVASSVQQTMDGGYIVGGSTTTYAVGSFDFWLLRLGADYCIEENQFRHNVPYILQATPNPFANKTTISWEMIDDRGIKLRVYDAAGCQVKSFDNLQMHYQKQIIWDGKNDSGEKLPNGIYFLNFDAGKSSGTMKLVILKN
jgi:hypothetical protein